MAPSEVSGGRKPRKRVVKRVTTRRVVKRTTRRMEGAGIHASKPKPKKTIRKVRVATASKTKEVRDRLRRKGKPRGDVNGARYVGDRIREESKKKGRKLTRTELSKLFKDAWAEYKLHKKK